MAGRKPPELFRLAKKNWFLFALVGICFVTLADASGTIAGMGAWLKCNRGADAVIFLIFLSSGLVLEAVQISKGIRDVKGTALALAIIFIIAPLLAYASTILPMDPGIRIGLFLVAVMPTTLTSGVVMTVAAGGNMAHALLITILANGLSVFTIPLSLGWLAGIGGAGGAVPIEKGKMMVQIAFLVLVPLFIGLMAKPKSRATAAFFQKGVPVFNQCMILVIVWIALSGAREAVLSGGAETLYVVVLSFFFHGVLLAAAFLSTGLFRLGPGRRESVIFMGGQKTLPLSILLQTSLFPEYGLALAFCVIHHFIHLMMDGYLVHRLGR